MSFNWEHYYTKGNTEVPTTATFPCFSLTSESKCCTFSCCQSEIKHETSTFSCHCDKIWCHLAVDVSGFQWCATCSDISPKPLHVQQKKKRLQPFEASFWVAAAMVLLGFLLIAVVCIWSGFRPMSHVCLQQCNLYHLHSSKAITELWHRALCVFYPE